MKKLNVNFVSLFRYALLKIVSCNNLRFRDVALYYSILQCWNKYRFPELLSINQQELMQFSKIGSTNTYRAALYNLEKHGLIKYYPSKDPSLGSKIFICIDKSVIGQKLTLPRGATDPEQSSSLNNSKSEQTYQIPEKKEVEEYFLEKGVTKKLAEGFFNVNSGRGWFDGKSKIVDWKSYANNYINNSSKSVTRTKNINTDVSTKKTFGSVKSGNHDN